MIAATQAGWFVYAAALFLAAGFAGFLPFNLHPARIFMGDSGAMLIGLLLAAAALVWLVDEPVEVPLPVSILMI